MQLHQWCYELHQAAHDFIKCFFIFDCLVRNRPALLQRILEIFLDERDTLCLVQIRRTFKMMVQAPVIQIDGTHYRFFIVTDKNLGMYKTWSIFIDFNACIDQSFIV